MSERYVYAWGNNKKRATLKGRECEVVARGAMDSVLVRFLDTGQCDVVSRRGLRMEDRVRVSERLLRTRDVAELLDVSCETVLRWHRSGKLPGGRRLASTVLRFDHDEIEAWLDGAKEAPGSEENSCTRSLPSPDAGRSLPVAPVHNLGGDDAR
jgi:predicted DNA-binding transcriptional regulator AlpA